MPGPTEFCATLAAATAAAAVAAGSWALYCTDAHNSIPEAPTLSGGLSGHRTTAVAAAAAFVRSNAPLRGSRPMRVAVVTFVGSFCPVTLAHVTAMKVAKQMLMGEAQLHMQRPSGLPVPDVVVGYMCANSESKVSKKLAKKGIASISERDRRMLLDLAVNRPDLSWIRSMDQAACEVDYRLPQSQRRVEVVEALIRQLPGYEITHYRLDGADVAVQWKAWEQADANNRFLCCGRPSERGQGSTADLLSAMRRSKNGNMAPGSQWYDQGFFVLLPEMQNISSTQVRSALYSGNMAVLENMLDKAVMEWNIKHGPYRPSTGSMRIGKTKYGNAAS